MKKSTDSIIAVVLDNNEVLFREIKSNDFDFLQRKITPKNKTISSVIDIITDNDSYYRKFFLTDSCCKTTKSDFEKDIIFRNNVMILIDDFWICGEGKYFSIDSEKNNKKSETRN